MLKDVQQGERVSCKATPRFSGFRVWLSAEHPEGSKGLCVGFNNKLSRSCALVDLQDV